MHGSTVAIRHKLNSKDDFTVLNVEYNKGKKEFYGVLKKTDKGILFTPMDERFGPMVVAKIPQNYLPTINADMDTYSFLAGTKFEEFKIKFKFYKVKF